MTPPRTRCPQGHERTPENVGKDRSCKTCKNAWSAERKRRKRAAEKEALAAMPTPADDSPRTAYNRRGVVNYLNRRRQRLTRLNRTAA